MKNKICLAILLCLLSADGIAQSLQDIRKEIDKTILSKKAIVGYSIEGVEKNDTLSFNANCHFPMQSVFKFHIAIVILSEIDKGKLAVNQKIKINKNELLQGLYSPIREKYPEGTILTIKELLEYTVSHSDNVGCDVLLKLIGGPIIVENYFEKKGFKDISIKINEETMQGNWNSQYLNWITPKASNQILKTYYLNQKNELSQESHKLLWQLMKKTSTGGKRLRGKLPKGAVVAHKTGWSGTNKEGVTAAVNNIGIIFLPNKKQFYISVFVTESIESIETNEDIIAEIAKTVWDYYNKQQ